jgi:glycosyltransferase involved in cell wall biosynthesis
MTPSSTPLRYGVDRMIATGTRIFGWGWIAHSERKVVALHLCVHGEGWERRLAADLGLERRDVREAFPDLVDAGASGFIVTGFLPDRGERRFELEVDLDDGTRERVDIGAQVQARARGNRKLKQLGWVAGAVWRRLKRGDIRGILRRARGQATSATAIDDAGIVKQLLPALGDFERVWLVIDHNMGGGANQYRRAFIAERVHAGDAVVFCTYNLPLLEYRLHVYRPGAEEQVFRIPGFLALEPLMQRAGGVSVVVNSPVSLEEPLALAEWLARTRRQYPRTHLLVTTHDYFAVCPSFVLLDADGRHCGVPDPSVCVGCLGRHEASFVALSPPTSIAAWRESWGRCLAAADEVRCFSEASRRLLLRAYPTLPRERVTLVPHRLDFAPSRAPRMDPAAPLVIGVVGEISPQKGANIASGMIDIIERENIDARVVVLGTLDVAHRSPRLEVTGRYRRADLPDLVEKNGINMFFFPSIWPETFSYVVAELMALGGPIVAFDLGAPAERLAAYPLGRLCAEVSARAALDTLVSFHDELAKEKLARVA